MKEAHCKQTDALGDTLEKNKKQIRALQPFVETNWNTILFALWYVTSSWFKDRKLLFWQANM